MRRKKDNGSRLQQACRAKTYYLSESISKEGERLGQLTGWKLDVAKALLSNSSSDQPADKISEIRNMLDAVLTIQGVNISGGDGDDGESPRTDSPAQLSQLIDLLPKNIRHRARIFLFPRPCASLREWLRFPMVPSAAPSSTFSSTIAPHGTTVSLYLWASTS
jgi:hypothetical protein